MEKMFVNRRQEAERNIGRVRRDLEQINVDAIHDVLEIGCGIEAVSVFLANSYGMNVQAADRLLDVGARDGRLCRSTGQHERADQRANR